MRPMTIHIARHRVPSGLRRPRRHARCRQDTRVLEDDLRHRHERRDAGDDSVRMLVPRSENLKYLSTRSTPLLRVGLDALGLCGRDASVNGRQLRASPLSRSSSTRATGTLAHARVKRRHLVG
jgi:hypothetical protein